MLERVSLTIDRLPAWLSLGLSITIAATGPFAGASETNASTDLSSFSFPALGASQRPRVEVAWNRYYDSRGMEEILQRLHSAFPHLTRLYSLGKSHEGRELWCLQVTSTNGLNADRKPGMFIDGNIHGNEVQGGEVVAYTAWYLCHQYGHLARVTELLDHTVFYLVPTVNPDARDRWLHTANNNSSARSGDVPEDNDQDGLFDEDDYDDLDGNGSITQMRIKDPAGRWKRDPQYPEYLLMRAEADEPGEYTLLGSEGIDNDGDGRVNEDPVGGYDANRNWAYDWQPPYIQPGAMDYPFCLPETRAVAQFILQRPNIAAAQSYHNAGGMILRSPGRETTKLHPEDDRVLAQIAERGERMLPFYKSMVLYRDLYAVWGGEIDWLTIGRGILTFSNEIWSRNSLYNTTSQGLRTEETEFMKHVLLNDGLYAWKEYDHPTYGKIEIGGTSKLWGRTPPSFLLEPECHRNMAFTLYHAAQMPRLKITAVEPERIGSDLFRVWVSIHNSRLIPTRTQQDVANRISPPDILTLSGPRVKVLSSGFIRERFFKRVDPVKRRPERVEVPTLSGMDTERVQFIVSGSGRFRVALDSAKGGLLSSEHELP